MARDETRIVLEGLFARASRDAQSTALGRKFTPDAEYSFGCPHFVLRERDGEKVQLHVCGVSDRNGQPHARTDQSFLVLASLPPAEPVHVDFLHVRIHGLILLEIVDSRNHWTVLNFWDQEGATTVLQRTAHMQQYTAV